jgi:hypothetical protein
MAIMIARVAVTHPTRKRLVAWLERDDVAFTGRDGERAGDSVTAHVERCSRCADRLEELSGEPDRSEPLGDEIGIALRDVYEPPAGINDRVLRAIDERKRADEEMSLFLGLLSIATDAAELLLPDADRTKSKTSDENRRTREDEV